MRCVFGGVGVVGVFSCVRVSAAPALSVAYPSIHFHQQTIDPAYAQELLLHARRLFDFAYKHQAQCQVSAPFYQSTGYIDELAYSAGACVCVYVCVRMWMGSEMVDWE